MVGYHLGEVRRRRLEIRSRILDHAAARTSIQAPLCRTARREMLSRAPTPKPHRRNSKTTMIVLVGGLLLAVVVGISFKGHAGASNQAGSPLEDATAVRHTSSDRPSTSTNPTGTHSRLALQQALDYGIERAQQLGGETAGAVWIAGDAQPVLGGTAAVAHRMWSMSKAVVTIAALEAVHDEPDAVLAQAMQDAITRSDNCAIRRVILGLQDRLGQGVSGAVAAFKGVLARAGARLVRAPQHAAAESACFHYLESHDGGLPGGDLGVAPQFGTAEWTEADAIRFTHALSAGTYGAPGAYLLRLMDLPKQGPLEEPPPPSAPQLDWGAGEAFPPA